MRLFLLSLVFASSVAKAQFETRTATTTSSQTAIKQGTIDFMGLNCKMDLGALVGDEIYFAKVNRNSDGTNGSDDYRNNSLPRYLPRRAKSKPGTEFPYTEFEDKMFKIVASSTKTENGNAWCWMNFTLQGPDGTMYEWSFPSADLHSIDAYLKSYLVKVKSDMVGKTFYLHKKFANRSSITVHDVSNKGYVLKNDVAYTCTGMSFFALSEGQGCADPCCFFKDPSGKEFCLVVDNYEIGGSISSELDYLWPEAEYLQYTNAKNAHEDSLNKAKALQADKWKADAKEREKRILTKYGKKVGGMILEGKVEIGMKKEACKEAWGEPSTTSKLSSGTGLVETWSYGGVKYLTFTNGVLKSIIE